jgi:hypothetical protein
MRCTTGSGSTTASTSAAAIALPNSRLLIYLAGTLSQGTLADREFSYAWMVQAPWPKGERWHGGGLFTDDTHVWFHHRPQAAAPRPHAPQRRQLEAGVSPKTIVAFTHNHLRYDDRGDAHRRTLEALARDIKDAAGREGLDLPPCTVGSLHAAQHAAGA